MTTEQQLPVIDLNDLQPDMAHSGAIAVKIIEAIVEGRINPLDFAVKKKCIEEALEEAYSNNMVRDAMVEEAQKHGGKTSHMGAKVEVAEVGIKYHFDNCSDPKLRELELKHAELADQVKQRKEWLKKVDTKGEKIVVDDEVVEIYPPFKTSSTSIKVSLKK